MRIFISYSRHDRSIADRINLGLRNEGYKVFFDRDDLSAGDEFHAEIRRQIKRADLFVFLASRASLDPGCYTINEFNLARERWPSPKGRVLTVNLDGIPVQELPAYLAAVTISEQEGDRVAAVLAEVAKMSRRLRQRRFAVVGAPMTLIAAAAGAVYWLYPPSPQPRKPCQLQGILSARGTPASARFDHLYLNIAYAGSTHSADVLSDGSVPGIDVGPLTEASKVWTIGLWGTQGLIDQQSVEGCPRSKIRVVLGKDYELVLDQR